MGASERLKTLLLVIASVCVGVLLFLLFDFLFSTWLVPDTKGKDVVDATLRPYLQKDLGWYELKRNHRGKDHWGSYVYDVTTDQYGFRTNPLGSKTGPADIIFLGDSFAYGMNGAWEDTFVGMYDLATPKRVLDAGVSSYSPTAYLYQYRKALRESALKPGHVVVVALDISDIQDEAGIWTDGDFHPVKREHLRSLGEKLLDRVRFTAAMYWFLEKFVERPDPDVVYNQPRSAFTWDNWQALDQNPPKRGYAPLGVSGGLLRAEQKLAELATLIRNNDGRLFFVIYPWPGQLEHEQKFNWAQYVNGVCRKIACAGVIDAQPAFAAYAAAHKNWYEDLYVVGDVHFSRKGNVLVYEAIRRTDPLE
jgi:hypothetical protein